MNSNKLNSIIKVECSSNKFSTIKPLPSHRTEAHRIQPSNNVKIKDKKTVFEKSKQLPRFHGNNLANSIVPLTSNDSLKSIPIKEFQCLKSDERKELNSSHHSHENDNAKTNVRMKKKFSRTSSDNQLVSRETKQEFKDIKKNQFSRSQSFYLNKPVAESAKLKSPKEAWHLECLDENENTLDDAKLTKSKQNIVPSYKNSEKKINCNFHIKTSEPLHEIKEINDDVSTKHKEVLPKRNTEISSKNIYYPNRRVFNEATKAVQNIPSIKIPISSENSKSLDKISSKVALSNRVIKFENNIIVVPSGDRKPSDNFSRTEIKNPSETSKPNENILNEKVAASTIANVPIENVPNTKINVIISSTNAKSVESTEYTSDVVSNDCVNTYNYNDPNISELHKTKKESLNDESLKVTSENYCSIKPCEDSESIPGTQIFKFTKNINKETKNQNNGCSSNKIITDEYCNRDSIIFPRENANKSPLPKYSGYKPRNGICFIPFKSMFSKPQNLTFEETMAIDISDNDPNNFLHRDPVTEISRNKYDKADKNPVHSSESSVNTPLNLTNLTPYLSSKDKEFIYKAREELKESIISAEKAKIKESFRGKKIHVNIFLKDKVEKQKSSFDTSTEDDEDINEDIPNRNNKICSFPNGQNIKSSSSKISTDQNLSNHSEANISTYAGNAASNIKTKEETNQFDKDMDKRETLKRRSSEPLRLHSNQSNLLKTIITENNKRIVRRKHKFKRNNTQITFNIETEYEIQNYNTQKEALQTPNRKEISNKENCNETDISQFPTDANPEETSSKDISNKPMQIALKPQSINHDEKVMHVFKKKLEESMELHRRLQFCGIKVTKETVVRALMSPSQIRIYEQFHNCSSV